MKLSAIIIAKNAAGTIGQTLASLSFADEVIVVDSGSNDNTVAIAEQHRARVIHQSWLGYGPQKNTGAGEATGDFLLFIDADEEVPPALAEEIKRATHYKLSPPQRDPATAGQTTHSLYWLRIVTVFLDRPLTHLYGHNPRFFHKSFARWTDAVVHEQVVRTGGQTVKLGDPDTGLLNTPLLHYSHRTVGSYLKKMHHYTTLDAQRMHQTNTHRSGKKVTPSPWLPYYLSLKQFIKLYAYRRGLLDGYAGLMWCILSAYYEWEMARKYLKLCA